MTSKNDNDSRSTKYCVLIDGDFGRHELFHDIHPYTIYRLAKLNDTLAVQQHTQNASKLLDNPLNIHYHIWYNSNAVDVDEYYEVLKLNYPQSIWLHYSLISTETTKNSNDNSILKFIIDDCQHEFDHIWLIHGIENRYEEFIQSLKSNDRLKTHISSYCWTENMKDGSNRLEYLIDNKIKDLAKDQIKTLTTEAGLCDETTVSTSDKRNKTFKNNKKLMCNIDGCKKQYSTEDGLKDHQKAKHADTQSVILDDVTSTLIAGASPKVAKHRQIECNIDNCKKKCKTENALKDHQLAQHSNIQTAVITSATEKPLDIIKKRKHECNIDSCEQSFKKRHTLLIHQIESHPILLRCLFDAECWKSNEKYMGMYYLQNHIILQHGNSFSQRLCPVPKCENTTLYLDWSILLAHIVRKHTNYLLNDPTTNTHELASTTSVIDTCSNEATATMHNIPSWDSNSPIKCIYNNCARQYWDEDQLKRHEAFEHPVPLSCPFDWHCQQSTKKYIGLWNLRKHVYSTHISPSLEPMCFDSKCNSEEEKATKFKTWDSVLRHILLVHLEAVGIILKSTPLTNRKISKKCSYETCHQSFKTGVDFQYHLVTYHPHPLRCPYNSECNKPSVKDAGIYLGLKELEKHIILKHLVQFPSLMCFDSHCSETKHVNNMETLMSHILKKHWQDIKSN